MSHFSRQLARSDCARWAKRRLKTLIITDVQEDGRTPLRATDDLIPCADLNLFPDCRILFSINGAVWECILKSDDVFGSVVADVSEYIFALVFKIKV